MSEAKKKKFYKRWWFWTVVVVMVIVALASGGDDEPELVTSGDEVPASAEVQQEFGIGDTVKLGDHQVTVTGVEKSAGTDMDKPKDGHEYVIVSVKVENVGNKNISYNPFHFKMSNSQGQIVDKALTIVDSETALSSGELAPGGSVSGTIAFEQPTGETLSLIFEPGAFSSRSVTINLD